MLSDQPTNRRVTLVASILTSKSYREQTDSDVDLLSDLDLWPFIFSSRHKQAMRWKICRANRSIWIVARFLCDSRDNDDVTFKRPKVVERKFKKIFSINNDTVLLWRGRFEAVLCISLPTESDSPRNSAYIGFDARKIPQFQASKAAET